MYAQPFLHSQIYSEYGIPDQDGGEKVGRCRRLQLNERRDLQAQIKVVRKQHAAVFREIRQNQQHYRQMERDSVSTLHRAFQRASPAPGQGKASPDRSMPRVQTPAERLDRLRAQTLVQNTRDKGPERER